MCAGESGDHVKHLVVKESDEGRTQLAEETLITTDDKRAYKVKHVIVDSMKDLKLRKESSGLGGADCLLCETKWKEWKDVELLTEASLLQEWQMKLKQFGNS